MKEKELREIPKEEQPYELPEGWKWVQGISVFKPMESTSPSNKTFRYIDIDSIDNEKREVRQSKIMETEHAPSRAKRKLHTGDTIFSLVRPYLNNIAYIDDGLSDCIASTGFFVCTPKGDIDSKYTYWMMVNPEVVAGLTTLMKGDNSPSIRAKDIYSYLFPLPPIDEQRRIVACIERLFAHLDAAEQKVRQVREASTRRQQSLLHQAIHGELTKKWREAHGITKERWRTVKLSEVCDRITDGTHHSPPNTAHGDVMYVTAKNIKEDGIDLTDITYVSHEVHDEIYKRCDVKKGDVLYIKDGATAGIATINDLDEPFSLLSSVALLRPDKKKLLAGYLKYTLNDPYLKRKILTSVAGNAITRLTLKKIKEIPISICDIAEQHEIVRCLDGLMTHERRIASACGTALRQIEALRTTILARAFRGKH